MCLSSQALILFISFLSEEIVHFSSESLLIQAEVGDVVWINRGDAWCTGEPPETRAQIEPVITWEGS